MAGMVRTSAIAQLRSLSGARSFREVYRYGERLSCGVVSAVFRKNTLGTIRLGFAVSRKLGGSVERNRFKRRVRSVLSGMDNPPCVDVVVSVRRKLGMVSGRAVICDVRELMDEIAASIGNGRDRAD